MKSSFQSLIVFFLIAMYSCSYSFCQQVISSNDYSKAFDTTHVKYGYLENSQLHDYSDNWDIDGDGILDKVLFMGNGAAHVYYTLLVKLSSEDSVHYYPNLSTDMPMLKVIKTINEFKTDNENLIKFTVFDFNHDGLHDIFLNIDDELGVNPSKVFVSYNARVKSLVVTSKFK